MTVDNKQYFGTASRNTDKNAFEAQQFLILQNLLKLETCTPVKVTAVNATGVDTVGTVTVQVLVNQVTGDNLAVPGVEIPNVPYFRLQGGGNAVIIDPSVGDIGMACFASRDISAVKAARSTAPPGSLRHHDFSDAMYVGGFLNSAPTQYIHFTDSGIVIHSPHAVTVNAPTATVAAPTITLNGDVSVNGNMAVTGAMTNNGKNVGSTHTHSGVQTGSGNTGAPN